jgi:hypothetical protein
VVGFGSNFLNALHADGRLVLNNGSHRAFALRGLGVTQVPCIVQRVTRREELEVVANDELARHADVYLRHPRPPVLKDYFDSELRTVVAAPRRWMQISVKWVAEPLAVPAA